MIVKKQLLKRENVFRQIAEEKPYLIFPFNVGKFHKEAERILVKEIPLSYVEDWLRGYRAKKGFKSEKSKTAD